MDNFLNIPWCVINQIPVYKVPAFRFLQGDGREILSDFVIFLSKVNWLLFYVCFDLLLFSTCYSTNFYKLLGGRGLSSKYI